MKRNKTSRAMQRSALASSLTACLCLGLSAPLLAAALPDAGTMHKVSSNTKANAQPKPAQKCLGDLRTLSAQMQKDGYWLQGAGNGYGYPIYGYSYGERAVTTPGGGGTQEATNYLWARPGYEVRTLIASANILAQGGQQQACEAVLAATRGIYKGYAAEMRKGDVPRADNPGWQHQEITTAQSVTGVSISFRSDQLVGTDVVTQQDEGLGTIHDIVMSPQTGKIAYLVIGRGGVFGIDEKYVPVPWEDFKVTSTTNLLVLNTTKSTMDAAPQVKEDRFSPRGNFGQESQKVDDYWKAHPSK